MTVGSPVHPLQSSHHHGQEDLDVQMQIGAFDRQ
jgi:hypothetical protein